MKKPSATNPLLKIGQAAKILGVSIDTLRRWEKAGKITAIRTPGGTRLYSLSVLRKLNPTAVENFQAKGFTTEELLLASQGRTLQDYTSSVIPANAGIQLETSYSELDPALRRDDNIKKSFLTKFLIGSAVFLVITLLITSWITASYLTNPKETQQFFKNNVAQGLLTPFHKLAEEVVTVISPEKAEQLGFISPAQSPPPSSTVHLPPSSPDVLAVTASSKFLEVNSDTQINGSLSVRDGINELSLEATPSANKFAASSGSTTLTVTNSSTIDQDLATTASPTFNTLNLSATKDQLVFQSGGPTGTLTWTPTATRVITLPDATTTLVGTDTTQTLTNKSLSGSSNTFTNIPNSALANSKVTVTAGTNLTGGGDVSLGSSITISLKDSPSIAGVLLLADGTAAAPSLSFASDTNTGLYRIGTDKIGLITGGSATSGITIDGSGNVGVGTITPAYQLQTTGNVGIGGSLTVSGLGVLNGGLNVTGYSNLTGNVGIGGTASITSLLSANGAASVTGSLCLNGECKTSWTGSGNYTASNGLTLSGTDFQLGGRLTQATGIDINSQNFGFLGGNVGIGTTAPDYTFKVLGSGYFSGFLGVGSSLNVSGNVGIGTSLSVTSAAALNTLNTTGLANLNSLNVTGVSNLTGNVGIGSSLTLTSAGVFSSGIKVSGHSDLATLSTSGNVGIGGSLTVLSGLSLPNSSIQNANLVNSAISVNATSGTGISVSGSPVSLGGTLTVAGIDATTTVKGVASFNSTNFSVSSGAVNTIQDIATSATPTFVGLNTTSGNVGIGTSATGSRLAVNGNSVIGWGTASVTAPSNGLAVFGNVGIGTTTANSNLSIAGNAHVGGLYQSISAPTNGLFVDGNVGIGATTSSNKLDVWGSTRLAGTLTVDSTGTFGNGLFGYAGVIAPASGLAISGNLGVGTTSPLGALHVVGQCVTGDTKLKRKRKKKGKKGEEDDWEDVEIKDIQSGDEILSMEADGTFVWRKVRGLMNMGRQETYKLITNKGKQIRTTGNHPYFVLEKRPVKKLKELYTTFEVDQSNRLEDMGIDSVVALVSDETDQIVTVKISKRIKRAIFKKHYHNKRKLYGPEMLATLIIYAIWDSGLKAGRLVIDKEYPNYEDYISTFITRTYPEIVVSFKSIGHQATAHRAAWSRATKKKTPTRSVLLKTMASLDFEESLAAELLHPGLVTGDSQSTRSSLPILYQSHLSLSRGEMSDAKWVPARTLRKGTLVATVDGWEVITAIYQTGVREQVWDIEVENTHNFVGNDIVAHNTYINGSLGIGAYSGLTVPTNGLAVSGNIGIGTTTANSNLSVVGNAHIGSLYQGISAPANGLFVDGNIGIGATTSSNKLDVWGNSRITGNLILDGALTVSSFGIGVVQSNASGVLSSSALNLAGGSSYITGILPIANGGTNNSSFTSGGAIFYNGTRLTQNTANFYWDNTNSRLGIGTSAPTATLDIAGTTSTITNSSGNITITPAGNLIVDTGNVGIGTTAVDYKLKVSGTGYFSGFLGVGSSMNVSGNLGIGQSLTVTSGTTLSGGLAVSGGSVVLPAGSIQNSELENSSISVTATSGTGISVSGSPVSLGGTLTVAGIDASTSVKGVASFNSTNFSVSSGAVNTIQDIATSATPTFSALTLSGNNAALTLTGSTPSLTSNTSLSIFPQAGNVGIGTSSPLYGALTVKGLGTGTGIALQTYSGSSLTQGLTVLDNGNVGIGTTNPDYNFRVQGTGYFSGFVGIGSSLNVSGNVGIGQSLTVTSGTVLSGGLAVSGGSVVLPAGSIQNSELENSSISVTATSGTGISVSGSPVSLGGTLTVAGIDASTSVKGVASFNSTNFSVSSGAVNTIQDIATSATPTFVGLNTTSGNLGIGTSATGSRLAINGNGVIGWGTTSVSGPTNGLAVSGNVGVGTTSPLGALHVVGQCVAWDTRIRIRRRRSRRHPELGSGSPDPEDEMLKQVQHDNMVGSGRDDILEWDYLEVMIKDILPGDEVLSLNEITQEFEYQRVEKLLDMGSKGVYELTTASGRKIKTTANHPYLVHLEGEKMQLHLRGGIEHQSPIKDAGWVKVINLSVGDQIAVGLLEESKVNKHQSNHTQEEGNSNSGININNIEFLIHRELLNTNDIAKQTIAPNTSTVNIPNFFHPLSFEKLGTITIAANQPADTLINRSAITDRSTGLIVSTKYQTNIERNTYQWDTIVSIKYLGYEHVYDLQIENTHNFLANDIVAHNTYINGNLGIGAYSGLTLPSNGLAVSGNLGIGTTTANSNLSIAGNAHIGGLFQGISAPTDGLFVDGNVGIGATTSSNKLDVWGNQRITGTLTVDQGTTLGGNLTLSGNLLPGANDTYDLGSDSLRWDELYLGPSTLHLGTSTSDEYTIAYDTTNNRLGFNVNGSGPAEIVMDSSGNLGIGTTSPAGILHLFTSGGTFLDIQRGKETADSPAGNAVIRFRNTTGTEKWGFGYSTQTGDGAGISLWQDGDINKLRLYIADGGNLGIGTASPLSKLAITGNVGIGVSFGAAASPVNGLAVEGNVGIGTTTSNSNLTVVGNAHIGSLYQNISAPTNGLFVDGNVGIGATTSSNKLDVWGNQRITGTLTVDQTASFGGNFTLSSGQFLAPNGTSSLPSYSFTNSTSTGMYSPSVNALSLNTNGASTPPFTITAGGNVGIGITAPGAKLEVRGNIYSSNSFYPGNNTIQTTRSFGDDGTSLTASSLKLGGTLNMNGQNITGTGGVQVNSDDFTIKNTGGNVKFRFKTSDGSLWIGGSTADGTAVAPLHVVGNGVFTGNVGIGFTSPDRKLQIGSDIDITSSVTSLLGANGSQLAITGSTAANLQKKLTLGIDTTDNYGVIQAGNLDGTAYNLALNPAGGNVGIGVTNPEDKLSVGDINIGTNYGGGYNGIWLNGGTSSTTYNFLSATSTTASLYINRPSTGDIVFREANTDQMILKATSGNLGIGTASPIAQLDVRNTNTSTGLHMYVGSSAGQFGILDNGNVGIGTTGPATKLDIDTGSNTLGLRLRGTAETTEIGDLYVGSGGQLVLSTANTGGANAFIEVDAEDNQWGFIIRDSSTGSSVYSNLYMNDAATDYLNIVVGADNATTGLVIQQGGNVGIGTASPVADLHLEGDATGTGVNFLSTGAAGGGGLVGILDNGNVGIGTTSPAGKLHLVTTSDPDPNLSAFGSEHFVVGAAGASGAGSGGVFISYDQTNNRGYLAAVSPGVSWRDLILQPLSGNVGIGEVAPGSKLAVSGGATIGASYDTTAAPSNGLIIEGNVGIGTSGPAIKLHVANTYTAPTGGVDANIFSLISNNGAVGNYAGLGILAGSSAASFIHFGDADDADIGKIDYWHSDNSMRFNTNTSEKVRITSDGNVGIGTTAPGARLTVVKEDNSTGAVASFYPANLSQGTRITYRGFETINDKMFIDAFTNKDIVMQTQSTGNVGIGATTPVYKLDVWGTARSTSLSGEGNRAVYSDAEGQLTNSSSDIRLKTNIENIPESIDVLAALQKLRGVYFNWRQDIPEATNLGTQRELGMIAQEVETVLPELIGTNADGYKSLNYAQFTGFLVEVNKAQQKELSAISLQLSDLNKQIASASAMLANLSVSDDGTLNVPRLKAGSIVLDPSIASVSATLNNNSVLSVIPSETRNLPSSEDPSLITQDDTTYYDLTGKIASLEERIAALEQQLSAVSYQPASQRGESSDEITEASTSAVLAESISESSPSSSLIAEDRRLTTTELNLTPPDILLVSNTSKVSFGSFEVSEATVSGMLTAYQTQIQDNFKVLGKTTLADTLIAGELTVDGTLSLTGSSLSTLGPLYIQNSSLAQGVDIFNGKVTIDPGGNITTRGSIIASEIKTNKLTISNTPIASSSANTPGVGFVPTDALSPGVNAASIGSAAIPAGQTKVPILTNQITPTSKVFITPRSSTSGQTPFVELVEPGTGFVVSIDNPVVKDIDFDWWIVEVQ